MSFNFKDPKQKQKVLIAVFLVMVLAIAVFWWFAFFKDKISIKGGIAPSANIILKEIKIDLEALDDPFIKELRPFQEIPVFRALLGKTNPFLPD